MKREIIVVHYRQEWKDRYEVEKKVIKNVLAKEVLKIYHIGGTSVKDLPSKPIIDMLLEVIKIKELDKSNKDMNKIGYIARGEYGIKGRRFYYKGEGIRSHHIHAFEKGDKNILRHLAFRDYLIEYPKVAKEYGKIKIKAAGENRRDICGYMQYKVEFIKRVEKEALEWKRKR